MLQYIQQSEGEMTVTSGERETSRGFKSVLCKLALRAVPEELCKLAQEAVTASSGLSSQPQLSTRVQTLLNENSWASWSQDHGTSRCNIECDELGFQSRQAY